MGYQERVKDFFKKAPNAHGFNIGDLVTCSCHGGLAIIVHLYDVESEVAPSMNMCQIYWIRYPHEGVKERLWMHTIERLRLFTDYEEIK